jgi:gluconolactonase
MKPFKVFQTFILLLLCFPTTISAGVFDNLVPVQIATGFQFTEGPQWHPNGYLVFSDVDGNKIYKWSEEKGLSILASGVGNPNGLTFVHDNMCRTTQSNDW